MEQAAALEQWLRQNRGHLHPHLAVSWSTQCGYHWWAKAAIPPTSTISVVPHSLSLSYLNALVDDEYPVFKRRRSDFKVEAIGFFYLMTQYIHRGKSFWKPYLDALPPPETSFTTPLWFDEPEDLAWLEGTDVLHTMLGRRAVYEQYFQSGISVLKGAGIDITPYTWDLFRWAVTMYSSRSFTSRALAPQDSKYWTSYKSSATGQRQTVLLDMSHTPAEDLDFPVLFPVQDVSNHSHEAHVEWSFEDKCFEIKLANDYAVEEGFEVLNNYGPKGNDELLLGYGFCIPDNPHDTVALTLKPLPADLQTDLKHVQSGYFTDSGDWSSEKATFRLCRPPSSTSSYPDLIFSTLPEPLLELLLYILRHERGLPFTFFHQPMQYLTTTENGRRYLPHIARMLVQSLIPKLHRLENVELPKDTANEKQRQASIYRREQINILQGTVTALRGFTRSLLKTSNAPGPRFVTYEGLIQLWCHHTSSETVAPFIRAVEAAAGSEDVDVLREAGWEDDLFVLVLSYIYLGATATSPYSGEGAQPYRWFLEALPEYVRVEESDRVVPNGTDAQTRLERAEALMPLITQAAADAAEHTSSNAWSDERWSAELIAELGGKLLQYDSMTMMVPRDDGRGEEARIVLYFHSP